MSDKSIQEQINEINRKLDLLLDEASVQRQNREAVNDLLEDLSVVGKDAFRHMVAELDHAGVELDREALGCLIIRLIRNIQNLGTIVETIESITDLAADMTPIIKQIGLDGVKKFNEMEQKGYFELLNQLAVTMDTIMSRYSKDDFKRLSEYLIPVADTLVSIADPGVINKINSVTGTLKEINPDQIEEYSIWKLMREINKPEVRKSLGFIMAFMKKITYNQNQTR
jgi:uncharacterized protein YjgD (DUF1641 family)